MALLDNVEELPLERLTKRQRRNLRKQGVLISGTQRFKLNFQLKNISPLTENQSITFQQFERGKNLLLHGYAGTGKAQPITTPIKILNGWKNIGDVKIGDRVITFDGSEVNVIGVYPQGLKDVYEIEFADGRKTVCCGEHLWEVHSYLWDSPRIFSLYEIEKHLKSNKRKTLTVPLFEGEKCENKFYIISPYILGVLLGDGNITHRVAFSCADEHIVENVKRELREEYSLNKRNEFDYVITHGKKNTSNLYKEELENLNLFGNKSYEKYIPEIYKNGSFGQKVSLIQGLMDTDGSVDKNGSIYYYTTSEKLKDDFVELIRSIGGMAFVTTKTPKFKYKGEIKIGKKCYIVRIRYNKPETLFTLPRKIEKISPNNQYKNCKLKIISIRKLEEQQECVCIKVDHPRELYVTNDYIVTHNTFLSLYLALREVFMDDSEYNSVVIIRSAVPSRDMGFMPGSDKEKMRYYEEPYVNICSELFGRGDAYEVLKEKGIVKFTTTSYLRGITFDNAIVIVDECQNNNFGELNTVITRLGENCRMIIAGDYRQTDLNKKNDESGLKDFMKIISKMKSFYDIDFHINDIVRSGLVKEYIIVKEELNL